MVGWGGGVGSGPKSCKVEQRYKSCHFSRRPSSFQQRSHSRILKSPKQNLVFVSSPSPNFPRPLHVWDFSATRYLNIETPTKCLPAGALFPNNIQLIRCSDSHVPSHKFQDATLRRHVRRVREKDFTIFVWILSVFCFLEVKIPRRHASRLDSFFMCTKSGRYLGCASFA